MPKEEIVNDDEVMDTPDDDGATLPEEDTPATETPLKVKVDGVGEVSPDEIKEALDAKRRLAEYEKQKSSWEASQHKKGEELNAKMRKLDDLTSQLINKQSEMERTLQESRRPAIDLNSIEDPVERTRAEVGLLKDEIAALKHAINTTSGELQKERDQKVITERATYWQGQLDTSLENVSEGLTEREMKFVKKTTTGILNSKNAAEWTPDFFQEAAKEARRELDEIKKEDRTSYASAAKSRQANNKTVPSGSTAGSTKKTRNQFNSQEEWLEYLDKTGG